MSTSSSGATGAPLSLEQLKAEVADGRIDTVIVGITDMQGRLQGKRVHAPYFVEHVLPHGTEGCNYLLAVDVDMNTVEGYALSRWTSGYGDFVMAHDLSSSRQKASIHRFRRSTRTAATPGARVHLSLMT